MLSVSQRLTWVVSPAAGIDFQPQNHSQPVTSLDRRTFSAPGMQYRHHHEAQTQDHRGQGNERPA